MNTILDWLGNEIKCPEGIERALAQKGEEKRKFYKNYVSSLEQIVGFKPEEELFAGIEGLNNWIELFNWTEREFNRHPFLREAFNSSAQFFNAFFVHPYGVRYREGQFVDVLKVEQTRDKDKDKKNTRIIEYVRGINVPLLLYLAVQEHERKRSVLESLDDVVGKDAIPITYHYQEEKRKRKIKGNIKARLSSNFWKNILSGSDDCVFITHDKAKAQVTFRDYWFASLGHMLHPAVYYLHFEAAGDKENKDLRKHFPYPLFKAILMKTSSSQQPLLVEGIVGENPNQFKSPRRFDGVCDFIDLSIWRFFAERYQKNNPGSELVYFPFHGQRSDKPHSVFDELVKEKYQPKKTDRPKMPLEAVCSQEYTKWAGAISNAGRELPLELFSEAFAHDSASKPEAKARVGAFVEPRGNVNGISVSEYVKKREGLYRALKWFSIISVSAVLTVSAINYAYMKIQESRLRQEYHTSYVSANGEVKDGTKKAVISDSLDLNGKILPINADEAKKQADILLDRLCDRVDHRSGIDDQNKLTCDIINREPDGVFDEGFQEKEDYDASYERVHLDLSNISAIKTVMVGVPRPFYLHVPFFNEKRDFMKRGGTEITDKSGKKYLIVPYLPSGGLEVHLAAGITMNLNTYFYRTAYPNKPIKFENKQSPLSCNQINGPEDAEFRSRVTEAAAQFIEYQLHQEISREERQRKSWDNDRSLDTILIEPSCVDGRLHYKIAILREVCAVYQAYGRETPHNCYNGKFIDLNTSEEIEMKGEALEDCLGQVALKEHITKEVCESQSEGDSHELANCIREAEANDLVHCDVEAKEALFTVNTQNLRKILASRSPQFGGLLYIEEREPLKYSYHPLPFEAALQLEQLLRPFEKE